MQGQRRKVMIRQTEEAKWQARQETGQSIGTKQTARGSGCGQGAKGRWKRPVTC